ncbi:hypothetical protein [Klebsiella pneumoniae]|uniref:hypothetical protein n=1 Tax=Klebsiella pneumoniae TaxID=573 RepID=UPI002E3709D4|nr:hypothetical protein [Klebsiella pneumoniae]
MRGGAKFETKGFDRVIRQRVKALAGISITVGIHRGKMNEGMDIATYAAWNNFGTKNAMGWELIPARPFMKYSSDYIAEWMKSSQYKELMSNIISGRLTPKQAIAIIGDKAMKITKATIKEKSLYKPNTPETIARKKGKSTPLVDSGVMGQTVTYKANVR